MNTRENDPSRVVPPLAPANVSAAAGENPEVIAAVEEYLDALQAGQPIDRHHFLARHAAIASELAKYLESVEFVQIAIPQLHRSLRPHSPTGNASIEKTAPERLALPQQDKPSGLPLQGR
jgi:hypothetical protein